MTRQGIDILFVLPTARGVEELKGPAFKRRSTRMEFLPIACAVQSPYAAVGACKTATAATSAKMEAPVQEQSSPAVRIKGTGACGGYEGNLIQRITEYSQRCVDMTADEDYDVIHAHDWVTFPAGIAMARRTGKPLIVHVHSTEFDRSGEKVNLPIYEIEREGMAKAARVITVSNLTKRIAVDRYGLPESRATVVHNGIAACNSVPRPCTCRGQKVVLFLGRITMQKGLEYFLQAARRVRSEVKNVRFVVAGWGDMGPAIMEHVARSDLRDHVRFTGFIRGREVDMAYRLSDVYVMPSVSEPFGLTALEAIQHDVPVVISRNSGAAEVLNRGALKCDHWDVEKMARHIVTVLTRPSVAAALRYNGHQEVRRLTWDVAAGKCVKVYRQVAPAGALN